ncbi:sulfatase family protein [Martelella endophytica]|uniref:sulfatase family protein n=1 Tax=Martelella endophytica TaxID=1486262 RepID=UPI00069675E8|nr:sulfatase [Martelella endophytica]
MQSEKAARRPNIIYVFADQLRRDALGCTGMANAATPNIDRFATEAMEMRQFVSNTPVCTAYRASLMTGKHTTSHGMVINELRMNPNQTCLGHLLTGAGYETSYIGKWHLFANQLGNHFDPKNSFVPRGPHRLGFDGEWKAYNFHHDNFSPAAYYHEETPEKIFYPDGVYEATAQTDLAIDTIRRMSDGASPFAMVLSYGPPHDPWGPDNVPEQYWRLFEHERFPNPPNYQDENDPYADEWARLSPDERAELESWRRGYHAQVASLDAEFGRLMAAIEAAGIADDTIVVFTADHGEMFGAHGRRAKLIFYEEAASVPFFIRWPGRTPAGGASDAAIGTVDVLPTLCGLAGIAYPDDVEGNNLAAEVKGAPGGPEVSLLMGCGATAAWEDGHEWRAARDARYTLARYRVDGATLLFDREADPWQLQNVADNRAYKAVRQRLESWMAAEMDRIKDGFRASSYYEKHWTDDDRCILRSETAEFGPAVPVGPALKAGE